MSTVQKCWYCEQSDAAVQVHLNRNLQNTSNTDETAVGSSQSRNEPRRRKLGTFSLSYCLLHYYTTSAVRCPNVDIINKRALDSQLPAVQQIFAEAYVQLKDELSDESTRQFANQRHDPLAILHDIHKPISRAKVSPVAKKRKSSSVDPLAGGFHHGIAVPERIIRTQKRSSEPKTMTSRRESSRKSIWNVVLDDKKVPAKDITSVAMSINDFAEVVSIQCSCGSDDVAKIGTSANRNHDMRKGETWGNKDRGDEILSKYQCLKCGKAWTEEES